MTPYMLFDNSISHFQVHSMHSEGQSLLLFRKTSTDVDDPLKGGEDVGSVAVDLSSNKDDVLWYVSYLTFKRLYLLILNRKFYLGEDD